MKRLTQIIFNGLTALSLLLCVATVVDWIRGRSNSDDLLWVNSTHTFLCSLRSSNGCMLLHWSHYPRPVRPVSGGFSFQSGPPAEELSDSLEVLAAAYCHIGRLRLASDVHGHVSVVPCWMIVLVTAILPVSRIGWRRRRRPGFCSKCSYDLCATPDRCPECGMVPENRNKF